MHAELKIGDSRFITNDVVGGNASKSPYAYGGSPASLWLYVDNSDVLFNRAVSAGARVQMPMADQFWGDRAGCVVDPAGYAWWNTRRAGTTGGGVLQANATDGSRAVNRVFTSAIYMGLNSRLQNLSGTPFD
jgi:hypothetical protein